MLSSNRMSAAVKYNYADWMFGGLMFLLCAGLTVLRVITGRVRSRTPNSCGSAPRSHPVECSAARPSGRPEENIRPQAIRSM